MEVNLRMMGDRSFSISTCLLILSLYLCSSTTVLSHKIGHVQSLPKESVQNHKDELTMSPTRTASATGSVSISPRSTINISSLSNNNNKNTNKVTNANSNGRKGIASHTTVRNSQRASAPTFTFSQTNANERSPAPSLKARRNGSSNDKDTVNQTEAVANSALKTRASLLTDMVERQQPHHHHFHHQHQHSLPRDGAKDNYHGQIPTNMSSNSGNSDHGVSDSEDSWIRMWAPEVDSTELKYNIMGGFLKREVWTIPLLAFASLNILLIVLFEVYVLCKARGPSRRHLFLGQMLLFGLFLCSAIALIFAICPSVTGCFLGRLGLGIAYSLIFSVLMVKCVFLLSLDSGVYLPASYQGFLLLFAVLVQVSIDTQWAIVYPPFLTGTALGGPLWTQCGSSYSHLLMTLSYIGFLIIVVGVLALKARGIRENYRESTYIGISILVSVPIWVSWTVAGWILQGKHQDACVAFGLVAQSLATFLIMFMPKGRQLAAMGKEGMYLEDQEDQCSGYSPSFFHFKPSKTYKTALFGDGNVYTTLEPTISTINPNVFFHRSDFHPGMIY